MTSFLLPFLRNYVAYFSLPFLLFIVFLSKFLSSYSTSSKNIPPSPPKLPIIGNLHQLGSLPHRSLCSLSKRYGDLMLFHLGSKPTLIVSSPKVAQEIMKTNDIIFSNRPKLSISSRIFYNGNDIAFANYGEYWKKMRSICVTQLLSNKKVESFRAIREEEVGLMVEKIKDSFGSEVNLREMIMTLTNDVICRACLGRKYSSNNEEGNEFKKLLNETMKLIGGFSLGDCIPWLSWVDWMKGLSSEVDKVAKRLDGILEKVIEENQKFLSTKNISSIESEKRDMANNFVQILLDYKSQNKGGLPLESIKAVILDMFAAGTDTTSTLIEWVIVELIRHPSIMHQLQQEVRKIVQGRKICEDDLEHMTFLKAVIKETLRLHPPAPLLVFRESSKDVKIHSFDIFAGTQVIVNAWAIQRDPLSWEEPEDFRPERFLKNSVIDFKGKDFHIIPFGAGRRICPGISFGVILTELVITTLVHEFDWKLPNEIEFEEVDMTEITGLTVRRRDLPIFIATSCVWN